MIVGCVLYAILAVLHFADPTFREIGYGYVLLATLPPWILWRRRRKRSVPRA